MRGAATVGIEAASVKQFLTLTLIGKDKSGVIASVTQTLFQHKANIEALEEQVTRGRFSMTLQASWSAEDFEEKKVRSALGALAVRLGMELKLHFSARGRRQRLAILVTREPHALEALLAAVRARRLAADPVVVIGNRPDLKPLAQKAGIPFVHVPFTERALAEKRVLEELEKAGADFIVLARFMKILSPDFVWRWKNKIINIHPSLLPAFPGASAYRQAYEKGVKVVGVTAHFVTPDLDQGPIICQEAFKTKPGESLAGIVKRGQAAEARALLRAVQLYLRKRLDVHWGRVYGV
ncbi:MAG: formyltetrahydrofolate deformylase [Candidatus Methylacidiphilales bacterium]|nr:formyltetrahydrofolate deformylase [Candidatus Methylacidiphilales bacterium]